MSQGSFPASASFGSSATSPWFSDETSRRFVPGCRAVVDGLLVFFGVFLFAVHAYEITGFSTGIEYWEQAVLFVSLLVLCLAWPCVVYLTVRSNYWQERQRILVCLSIVLVQYTAVALLLLKLADYPVIANDMLFRISLLAAATIVCIGLVSIEKRLRLVDCGEELPERVASKRQCVGRIFYGCLFGMLTICCLTVPFIYVRGIFDGSLADRLEAVYGCQVNGLNFFCVTALSLFLSVIHLLLAISSWGYLQNFHRQIVPSFKEKVPPVYQPTVTAISVCIGGTFIHIFSFLLFHPGPGVASWILLATVIFAWAGYKRSSAKVATELKQSSVA